MAVYTDIEGSEFQELLAAYSLGAFKSAQGIAEGVENSNFLLLTDQGPFIATVFEKRVKEGDLPFFMALMEHLATHGIPSPLPIHDKKGKVLQTVQGKKLCIVRFLEGSWPRRVAVDHCAAIGDVLARMHLASQNFGMTRDNAMGLTAWKQLYRQTEEQAHQVAPTLAEEIGTALKLVEQHWPKQLPSGVIHADLFPDNALFQGEELTGLLDFYFACNDFFAYDLAICLNAWCFEDGWEFNMTKAKALLDGYQKKRALAQEEKDALPMLCAGAALRFLLTRLYDYLNQVSGAVVKVKDPKEYLHKLRFHLQVKDYRGYGL